MFNNRNNDLNEEDSINPPKRLGRPPDGDSASSPRTLSIPNEDWEFIDDRRDYMGRGQFFIRCVRFLDKLGNVLQLVCQKQTSVQIPALLLLTVHEWDSLKKCLDEAGLSVLTAQFPNAPRAVETSKTYKMANGTRAFVMKNPAGQRRNA